MYYILKECNFSVNRNKNKTKKIIFKNRDLPVFGFFFFFKKTISYEFMPRGDMKKKDWIWGTLFNISKTFLTNNAIWCYLEHIHMSWELHALWALFPPVGISALREGTSPTRAVLIPRCWQSSAVLRMWGSVQHCQGLSWVCAALLQRDLWWN